MKNLKFTMAWLAIFALLFTSCSKEEANVLPNDQELVQVTFGSLLNQFKTQSKQADPGECGEGTPDYILVGITDADNVYIDDGVADDGDDYIEVGVVWNEELETYETMYSELLALPAGDYTLQTFVVYDEEDDVLWVAPIEGGAYATNVDNPLPEDFTLVAGTKPYINVDVLCFIPREEEAYGYIFMDFDLTEIENNFCFFVNFCDGRDYPAYFSVDVWTTGYGEGVQIIDSAVNSIDDSNDWPAASVLCVPLPELMGDDTYFVTITVLNHDALEYDADETDVYQFELSQADINAQLEQEPAYEHVRIGCGDDDDGGTGGGDDEGCEVAAACELTVPGELGAFCNVTSLEGSDAGWVKVDSAEELFLTYTEDIGGNVIRVATVDVSVTEENEITVVLDTPESEMEVINETDNITAYAIEVRPSLDNGQMSDECWESSCANLIREFGSISETFDGLTYDYPVFVRVSTVSCFEPLE